MDGGPLSFERWYRAEHPRLLGLLTVVAADADLGREATAEAFTGALERWERVCEMESPAAWTYRVGVNVVRRRLRRAAVEGRLWARRGGNEAVPPPAFDPDVWAALRSLPARQRTAVALRYLCDLPQADVARIMGVASGTVSATLTAARRRLQVLLGQPVPEPVEVPGA
jgi:RNA polymerase sigma-70 factor (ECF subfamily)